MNIILKAGAVSFYLAPLSIAVQYNCDSTSHNHSQHVILKRIRSVSQKRCRQTLSRHISLLNPGSNNTTLRTSSERAVSHRRCSFTLGVLWKYLSLYYVFLTGEADWEERLCVNLQAADWKTAQTRLILFQSQSLRGKRTSEVFSCFLQHVWINLSVNSSKINVTSLVNT